MINNDWQALGVGLLDTQEIARIVATVNEQCGRHCIAWSLLLFINTLEITASSLPECTVQYTIPSLLISYLYRWL